MSLMQGTVSDSKFRILIPNTDFGHLRSQWLSWVLSTVPGTHQGASLSLSADCSESHVWRDVMTDQLVLGISPAIPLASCGTYCREFLVRDTQQSPPVSLTATWLAWTRTT